MKNQVIKVLTKEHGKKVIEYWKSRGIDTRDYTGCNTEEDGYHCYYGIINGYFDNYVLTKVKAYNCEIIELPGYTRKIEDGLKKDDVIVNDKGVRRLILEVLGDLVFPSCINYFDKSGGNYLLKELIDYGYELEQPEPPKKEIPELTMEEAIEKMGFEFKIKK